MKLGYLILALYFYFYLHHIDGKYVLDSNFAHVSNGPRISKTLLFYLTRFESFLTFSFN